MKQYTLTKAYQALMRLSNLSLPIKTAHSVYMMMKTLEPAYECGSNVEKDLLNKLGITVEKDRIVTKNQETLEQYFQGMKELNDTDVDITISPICIAFDDIDNQRIKPSDIKSLEGFVNFH